MCVGMSQNHLHIDRSIESRRETSAADVALSRTMAAVDYFTVRLALLRARIDEHFVPLVLPSEDEADGDVWRATRVNRSTLDGWEGESVICWHRRPALASIISNHHQRPAPRIINSRHHQRPPSAITISSSSAIIISDQHQR